MKAAFLTGIRQIEIRETPHPGLPGPNEVLLKTVTVGVCGSDVHYYVDGKIGDQVVKFPYRVGHEFSGRVVEVGSNVRKLTSGSLVAVDPAMACGNCSQCKEGRENTCEKLRFLGCPGEAEGCLSEYILMPEECCFPVPDKLSSSEAALVEPLSVAVYAVHRAGLITGKKVGILGCGPIGLSVLYTVLSEGAVPYVTDKIGERTQISRDAGAVWSGNPLENDVVQGIREREPDGLDIVFECCGQQDAIDQAIDLLKPGGKLLIIGIPTINRVDFSVDQMRRKEISILNVRRQNECVQAAIDFVAENDTDLFVTHEFSLDQSQQAFDLVADYADGVMKAMIHME